MTTIVDILSKHGSTAILNHISEKPWGEIEESDYTLQQWHAACLIHQHSGPPTSKEQCKLPVRTPSGALNRDGVFAAAGALAGARTPINASAAEKKAAATTLMRYYGMLNATPPDSLKQMAGMSMMQIESVIGNVLEHHGVKGMRWGVRRAESSGEGSGVSPSGVTRVKNKLSNIKGGGSSGSAKALPPSEDVQRVHAAMDKISKGNTSALSNRELQDVVTRMNLEQQYTRLSTQDNVNRMLQGHEFIKKALQVGKTLNDINKFVHSPVGTAMRLGLEGKTELIPEALDTSKKGKK